MVHVVELAPDRLDSSPSDKMAAPLAMVDFRSRLGKKQQEASTIGAGEHGELGQRQEKTPKHRAEMPGLSRLIDVGYFGKWRGPGVIRSGPQSELILNQWLRVLYSANTFIKTRPFPPRREYKHSG
jgi:hypothetical protein